MGEDGQPIWFLPLSDGRRATGLPRADLRRAAGPDLVGGHRDRRPRHGEGSSPTRPTASSRASGPATACGWTSTSSRSRRAAPRSSSPTTTARATSRRGAGPSADASPTAWSRRSTSRPGACSSQWNAMGSVPLDRQLPQDHAGAHAVGRVPPELRRRGARRRPARLRDATRTRSTRSTAPPARIRSRIGGKRSSFRMGEGTHFGLQHDARAQADGTIRIFDNGLRGERRRSRALWIPLDRQAGTATLVRTAQHPLQILAGHPGQRAAAPERRHVLRLGVAGAHLRAEPRRGAAARPAPAARLRHVPRLPPALGRSARDGAGDRGGDAPRRRHHGLRELERRDGGRGVAGPRGRLPGDPAGRRHRPATRVRDADPAPAPGSRRRRSARSTRPARSWRSPASSPRSPTWQDPRRGAVSRLQDGES